MSVLAKVLQRMAVRRRSRARASRRSVDAVRRAVTAKGGTWEGTRLIRETRDAK